MSFYSATILADSPQAYYRLDESSGLVAHDETANHYTGVLSGGGITFAQVGALSGDSDTAIRFGGSDTLSLPYTLNPSLWSVLSLEFWIKLSGGWQYVAVTADNNSGILLYLNGVPVLNGVGSGDAILIDTDMYYAGSAQAGNLDEIALYNYKLTAAQIAQHYAVGLNNLNIYGTLEPFEVVILYVDGYILEVPLSQMRGPGIYQVEEGNVTGFTPLPAH